MLAFRPAGLSPLVQRPPPLQFILKRGSYMYTLLASRRSPRDDSEVIDDSEPEREERRLRLKTQRRADRKVSEPHTTAPGHIVLCALEMKASTVNCGIVEISGAPSLVLLSSMLTVNLVDDSDNGPNTDVSKVQEIPSQLPTVDAARAANGDPANSERSRPLPPPAPHHLQHQTQVLDLHFPLFLVWPDMHTLGLGVRLFWWPLGLRHRGLSRTQPRLKLLSSKCPPSKSPRLLHIASPRSQTRNSRDSCFACHVSSLGPYERQLHRR